jgi:pimeloyl-ACP methyl ester carboxylesterase
MNKLTFVLAALLPTSALAQTPLQFATRTVTVGNQTFEIEQGTLTVPADHRKPEGSKFELAVVRLRSTSPTPAAPIVYLAGGPGASGIAAARSGLYLELFNKLRAVADVILLDQRGTGSSTPRPVCTPGGPIPTDVFTTESRAAQLYSQHIRACAGEWQAKGVDLGVFNSEQSADDINALRIALGANKISLFGFSYGTHLGLAAIRRHGPNIERAALAGVEGPDHNWKLPTTTEKQLDRISALAAADPSVTRVLPDLKSAVREVLQRVRREPWVVQVRDRGAQTDVDLPIGDYGMRYLIFRDLGDTNDLPNYPQWIAEMARGDATYLTRIAERRFNELRSINLMSVATDCASGGSSARKARVTREAAGTVMGDIANIFFDQRCAAVGVPDLGDEFRGALRTNVPTLFISGTLDSQTPPEQVEEVRRGFAHSVHLIVENAGHESTLPDERVEDFMLRFYRGEQVRDTTIALPPVKFVIR